ncbi:MAG TPA: long-chain fatty acid--CoA ligase [Gemmatimonadaceae bacterium]|nr:long-chain fatty acid--CoA ligase [Gemmatimonadaceae bacterium]
MIVASGGPRPDQPGTLCQLFFEAVEQHDRPDALRHRVNGDWRDISHRELLARVRRTGRGLQSLGVRPGDRVAILSENRPEWAIADFACLTSHVVDVPIYPQLPADQVAYILRDSGAIAAFVSDAAQAAKIVAKRAELPALRHVVVFDAGGAPGADLTLDALEERGGADDERAAAEYRGNALTVRPDDVATLIYTSGTTGAPKGVMLTHDNFWSNVNACITRVPDAFADGEHNVALSFLPLSHVFERMAGHYEAFRTGTTIAYAESIDTVARDLEEVRPTIACSVPRLYEKMYARVLENALAAGTIRKRVFFWARHAATRWADATLAGRDPGALLGLQYRIARRLVFSKLHARTGGRLRYFVSGGAPLAPAINQFFYAAGLQILEGYGLTETSPVIAFNTPTEFRIGTVGRAIPGVEVRIAHDGEILTRGPHVMRGYFENPEATREAIDDDGWFHTGDIGELRDGFLAITDRKKDIIVTAGGKNIAPQPIENLVKANKYVSQAVMLGDGRKFPVMVVVPNFEQLERWARFKNLLWTDRPQLVALPLVQAKMEKEIFGRVTSLASFERPKKIALLPHELTIEGGELTPTLKVKRKVVTERYAALIDALYRE